MDWKRVLAYISGSVDQELRNGHAKSRKNFSTEDYCIVGTYEKGTLKTDVAASACPSDRGLLPLPLHPRYQRPDPPLAEVQVAEEKRLLKRWGEVEQCKHLPGWVSPHQRKRA